LLPLLLPCHLKRLSKTRDNREKKLNGTAVSDGNLLGKLAARRSKLLDLLDDIEAFNNLAKDDVGTVEPAGDNGGDEELRSVGVLASVGHAQQTRLGVLHLEVLVGELLAVDGLAAGAVALSEVTTLKHELRDDAVEGGALVTESVLTSGELTEVLCCLGNDVVVEFEDDPASWLLVDGDVEVNVGHFEKRFFLSIQSKIDGTDRVWIDLF